VPTVPDEVPAAVGGIEELRGEPLDPSVDRDVIDLDAALSEELLDVAVGQAEPQVPPDRSRSARPVGARSCTREIRPTDHCKDTTVGHLMGQTGLPSAPVIIAAS
jgi:hypothetical protein